MPGVVAPTPAVSPHEGRDLCTVASAVFPAHPRGPTNIYWADFGVLATLHSNLGDRGNFILKIK